MFLDESVEEIVVGSLGIVVEVFEDVGFVEEVEESYL